MRNGEVAETKALRKTVNNNNNNEQDDAVDVLRSIFTRLERCDKT